MLQKLTSGVMQRTIDYWTKSPDEAHNRRRLIFFLIMLAVLAIAWEFIASYDQNRVTLINNFLSTLLWLVGIYVGGSVAAGTTLPVFDPGAVAAAPPNGNVPGGAGEGAGGAPAGPGGPQPNNASPDVGRLALASYVTPNTFGHTAEVQEAAKYATQLKAAADATGLEIALICAVVSRESMWGFTLRPRGPGGTGDWSPRDPAKWHFAMPPDGLGWGRGLMQIDYQDEFAKTGNWQDAGENLMYGSKELVGNIDYFTKLAGAMKVADPQRAGIAAYNCGRGNVQLALEKGVDVDTYTTGHNYSADVMKRVGWFSQQTVLDV